VAAAVGHVRTHFVGRGAADLRAAIELGETWPAFDWGTYLRIGPALLLAMARQRLRRTRVSMEAGWPTEATP
jgi:hypothetical protein